MSLSALHITNSGLSDLDLIFKLFESAIQYQQNNGYDLWPRFDRQLIEKEISEKRHWKIIDGNTIVCIFSVLYNDPIIWGEERDSQPAVYLHRIAVNPLFKGKGMMRLIKKWSLAHARSCGKKYLRMDTWGNNENLRSYYIACGFNYIGQQHLAEVEGQAAHYGGSVLSLFELEV